MLEKYGIDESKVYKVVVIATMSSGKSTFINALIGDDILPSQNAACTAKIIPILDNDTAKEFKAYIEYKNGSKEIVTIDKDSSVNGFNLSDEIKDILIEGRIKGIRNTEKIALLIDTPGTNFSGDNTHQRQTYELIDNFNEGMFLYIINVTQVGIKDDLELLTYANNKIKNSDGKIKLLFAVNKIDEFDLGKEDIEETINEIEVYLKANKVDNPQVLPVSALAAKLFKMGINNKQLTRKEQRDFRDYYDLFKAEGYSLKKYAHIEETCNNNESIIIGKESFKIGDVLRAIDNTGINYIEKLIENEIILKTKIFTPQIEFNLSGNNEEIQDNLICVKKSNVYIEYNPYTVETKIEIDGQEISNESPLKYCKNKRLQYWLEKSRNWRGIGEELKGATNSVGKIDITFKGRKIDFDDLKLTLDKYNNSRSETKFKLKFIEGKEDKDILDKIDSLFKEIQAGPVEELKTDDLKRTYEEVKSSKFKISVLATMSSGKSTLINSLIGYELLPSKNMACTATIATITDNDDAKEFTAICRDSNENIIYDKKSITLQDVEKYNADEKVTYIDIEGRIPGISSAKLNLLLYDTLGPNNSRNEMHEKLTQSVIQDEKKGVVLYVLNATQFGIKDDTSLIKEISSQMKKGDKQSKDRFIFVINRCDELDYEVGESIDNLLIRVREYLKKYDIEEPNLFPVTAQGAKLIRMFKNGANFTRKEQKELDGIVEYFNDLDGYHFEKKCTLSEYCRRNTERKLSYAIKNEDKYEEALIHTGIQCVEEMINEYLEKYACPVKVNKIYNLIMSELNYIKIDYKIERDKRKSKYFEENKKNREGIEKRKKIIRNIYKLKLIVEKKLIDISIDSETDISERIVEGKIKRMKNFLISLNNGLYRTRCFIKEVKEIDVDVDKLFKIIEEKNMIKSYSVFKEREYLGSNKIYSTPKKCLFNNIFSRNEVNDFDMSTRINSHADWIVREDIYVDYNKVLKLLVNEVETNVIEYIDNIKNVVNLQIRDLEIICRNSELNIDTEEKVVNEYLDKINFVCDI